MGKAKPSQGWKVGYSQPIPESPDWGCPEPEGPDVRWTLMVTWPGGVPTHHAYATRQAAASAADRLRAAGATVAHTCWRESADRRAVAGRAPTGRHGEPPATHSGDTDGHRRSP